MSPIQSLVEIVLKHLEQVPKAAQTSDKLLSYHLTEAKRITDLLINYAEFTKARALSSPSTIPFPPSKRVPVNEYRPPNPSDLSNTGINLSQLPLQPDNPVHQEQPKNQN